MVWVRLAALLCLLAGLGSPASAQTFPKFTGFVVDAANILTPDQEAALTAKLDSLQKDTNHQLVVATIPDLQGYPIEDYGFRLGRAWGVGLKDADNGAILLVAPNERKLRIEVGYGLEPVVTDAISSTIINQRMVPLLKGGNMPGAIDAGADALIEQLRLPDDQARAKAATAAAEYDKTHAARSRRSGGTPFGVIFLIAIVAFVMLAHGRGRNRSQAAKGPWGSRRSRRSGDSDWPIWLWTAAELASHASRNGGGGGGGGIFGGGGGGGGWGGGGFSGGGGGSFGGGGASGGW